MQAPNSEPFRVGFLNVDSYSHMPLWAPHINPRPGEKDTPFTGMRITHCWDIEYEKAKAVAEPYGCEVVKNFDDMLGKVDGVISGGYYNHPWNHILHEPYLEAGLPNLINRPFANSLAKARQMIELAQKNGATSLRHRVMSTTMPSHAPRRGQAINKSSATRRRIRSTTIPHMGSTVSIWSVEQLQRRGIRLCPSHIKRIVGIARPVSSLSSTLIATVVNSTGRSIR